MIPENASDHLICYDKKKKEYANNTEKDENIISVVSISH